MVPENRQSGMFGRVSKVKAKGKTRIRAFVAGAVGAILAFGGAELAHGLYAGVPFIFLAIAQGIIELTPGSFATRAIETLGQADITVLISSTVVGALAVAGLLAVLSLRSRIAALVGVGALATIAILAAFSEPSFAPAATIITVVAGIGLGVAAAEFLLRSSGLRPGSSPEPGEDAPPTMDVRSREA